MNGSSLFARSSGYPLSLLTVPIRPLEESPFVRRGVEVAEILTARFLFEYAHNKNDITKYAEIASTVHLLK